MRMWLPCLFLTLAHPMTCFARRISQVSYSFSFWGALPSLPLPRDDGIFSALCRARVLINSRLIMRSGLSASPVVTNAAVALPRIKIGIARFSPWRVCYL